jgi:hypothetical protein
VLPVAPVAPLPSNKTKSASAVPFLHQYKLDDVPATILTIIVL